MSKASACHWYLFFAIALIPVLVITCSGQTDAAESLKPLLETLAKNKLSGSLEFTGRCDSLRAGAYPEFPRLSAPATDEKVPSTEFVTCSKTIPTLVSRKMLTVRFEWVSVG